MITIMIIFIVIIIIVIITIIIIKSIILFYCKHICGAYSSYQLVIVGHSLGAGIAAVLALTMRAMYPTLKCVIYGVPGSVFDWRTAQGIYNCFCICSYFFRFCFSLFCF